MLTNFSVDVILEHQMGRQPCRSLRALGAASRLRDFVILLASWALLSMCNSAPAAAQVAAGSGGEPSDQELRKEIRVEPTVGDAAIAARIERILASTTWFRGAHVAVREGVVFLNGNTDTLEHRRWAGRLAESTEGTVAVVNRLEVEADAELTFGFARTEFARIGRQALQTWPWVTLAIAIILLSWLLSHIVRRAALRLLAARIASPLLLRVVARLISIPVLLLGVYFVLRVSGLTRLALTLLGGTGLVGIVAGLAFRDIAENFLASILLSVRHPFRTGDLIDVNGKKGIVRNLNMRTTALLTLDGNYVQIPNAIVFKSTITNYSSAASRRAEYTVGVGYSSPTVKAQALIADVLRQHPAVLKNPEPLVLVQELGAASVNLRVYYWFASATYSPEKISSSLMRLTKDALLEAGIELPDPAREVVFPNGVPIIQNDAAKTNIDRRMMPPQPHDRATASAAEGDLRNELSELTEETGLNPPGQERNLLTG